MVELCTALSTKSMQGQVDTVLPKFSSWLPSTYASIHIHIHIHLHIHIHVVTASCLEETS